MKSINKFYLVLLLIIIIFTQGVNNLAYSEEYYYSPFTGKLIEEMSFQKVVMAVIENSDQARPQAGLNSASIVYEYLVEGGITRFLALYWREIPNKIGPIRSVRPYLIETADSYNGVLLHAGASPDGFSMLQNTDINHLDQIYNGNFYWRGSTKKTPHNLYTGYFKISDYLNEITGQEYNPRFNFKQFSLINSDKINSKKIIIDYWGNYNVRYKYDIKNNNYKRYIYDYETPHLNVDNEQITVDNIIVKFVDTKIQDDEGRLGLEINGSGRAYYFVDGVFIEGKWEKNEGEWSNFYTKNDELVELNPGKTWIQVVPQSAEVIYQRGDFSEERN